MAPACSRSMRPPVARERPPPDARLPRPTLRAAETYREKASRRSFAFFSARSISYDVPSREKLTVSSAERFSSRSSLRMTWTLRAIKRSSLLFPSPVNGWVRHRRQRLDYTTPADHSERQSTPFTEWGERKRTFSQFQELSGRTKGNR